MAPKRRAASKPPSPLATRILAQRERGRSEVSLERLEADFADASRYDIVASLKELERAGCGQFFVGRKGQRSRFVWAREQSADAPRSSRNAGDAATPRSVPAASALRALTAAPAFSSEPSPRSSKRKTLAPVGKRLDRLELSSRAGRRVPSTPSPPALAAPTPLLAAAPRTLRHSFHLRPGLLVSIELPEDVTATEVARFCSFLEAIPFTGEPRG